MYINTRNSADADKPARRL